MAEFNPTPTVSCSFQSVTHRLQAAADPDAARLRLVSAERDGYSVAILLRKMSLAGFT